MEISATISLPRPPPPPSLPLSSSRSSFLTSTSSAAFMKKVKTSNSLVLGRARTTTERARRGFSCNCLFGLGVPELVVIAGVAALVFGPKKLPEVGKSIGKTVKSFQQAAKEFESELKKEPDSITDAPAEKPTAVSEGDKQGAEVPRSKENV